MTIGRDSFIHSILTILGLKNLYGDMNRYPEIKDEEFIHLEPEFIFLSSEPYPFTMKEVEELKAVFKNSKILLVNGEAFSWYGTRLLKLEEYLDDMAQFVQLDGPGK